LISRWIDFAVKSEKIRYLLVGGYNTLFGYGLFVGLVLAFGDWLHYLAILVISHIIAVTNAYYAYRLFVFRDGATGLKSYLRFHSVYIASLGFNFIALPFLVEVVRLSPIVAQGIVIAFTVVMSYILHRRFSFAK
jgi:putative flippase GtrA